VGDNSVLQEMSSQSVIAEFLVDQYATRRKQSQTAVGTAPYELIESLVRVHNWIVGEAAGSTFIDSNRFVV